MEKSNNTNDLQKLIKNTGSVDEIIEIDALNNIYSLKVNYLKDWTTHSIIGLKNCFLKTNRETEKYQFNLITVKDSDNLDPNNFKEANFIFEISNKYEN